MNAIGRRRRIQKPCGHSGEFESLESRAYLSSVPFEAPVNLTTSTVGISPTAVQLADFNGDSRTDLVVANSTDSISVLNSNGDGSFAAPVNIPVVGTPTALAVGHFDTTGNLDIVAGTSGSPGSVSIIVGNGDGTFLPANDIAALDDNSAIAVGDFNNDNHADILSVSSSAAPSGNAMLLLGNGTAGAFSQAPFNLPFGNVSAVAVGDFNGDGNLDFVVANNQNSSVSVLMGNGDGTFQAPVTYATAALPTSIVVSDITGKTLANGKPELDIITGNASGSVTYLANNGDGTFAAGVNSAASGGAGAGPSSLVAGDFNNDGRIDLLAPLTPGGADALLLLGNGNGTFTASHTFSIGLGGNDRAAVGDLNGDGNADVVLASSTQVSGILNTFAVGSTSSTVSFTAAATSINAGDSDTLSATVAPTAATGSVNFLDNGVSIGTANVADGVAVLTPTLNAPGEQAITVVYSGDGTYASSISTAITVVVAGTPIESQPLIPVIERSTLPSALVGGVAAHGTATVQMTNSTSAKINGAITINLYASGNGVVDANSILVGTMKKKLLVESDHTFNASVPIKLLAGTLPVGKYRLLAQTLDPSNNLSVSTTGPSVDVAAPFVSLNESFTHLVLASSLVGGSKSSAVALIRITNSGNVASSGVTPVVLYVSPDGTPGTGTSPNSIRKKLVIGVGKSIVVSLPLKAIPNVATGVYSVGVQVTDPTGGDSFANATSPVSIGTPTIDLAGSFFNVPSVATSGKKMTVSLNITNDGNVTAKGPLQIGFAGSASSDGSNAVSLSVVSVSINVRAGGTQRLRLAVPIPLDALVGDNYLVATVDPANVFADPNLANNVSISVKPISFK